MMNETEDSTLFKRKETNLIQIGVKSPYKANGMFGELVEDCTPLVLIPSKRSVLNPRLVIPHGFDSIVSHKSKVLGVYRPGSYIRSPYYEISYIVNKQRIPYHFTLVDCPTIDNVRLSLEIDFLFHVADSMKFVMQIAPENMEELLRATQAESIRSLVRTITVAQARDLRGMNAEDMLITLNDKLNPYGIQIDQVTIANVVLPRDISASLQATTEYESKNHLLVKENVLKSTQLKNSEEVKSKTQERNNQKDMTVKKSEKERRIIEQEIEAVETATKTKIDEVNAAMKDKKDAVEAKRREELSKISIERKDLINDTMEEGKKKAHEIKMESLRYELKVKMETLSKIADNKARINTIHNETEKYVSKKLAPRRAYQMELQRLDVLKALAKNSNAIISGDTKGDPMAQLVTSTSTAKILGITKK